MAPLAAWEAMNLEETAPLKDVSDGHFHLLGDLAKGGTATEAQRTVSVCEPSAPPAPAGTSAVLTETPAAGSPPCVGEPERSAGPGLSAEGPRSGSPRGSQVSK
eukprot:3857334-Lingulodinium_polyedra.AAC.1